MVWQLSNRRRLGFSLFQRVFPSSNPIASQTDLVELNIQTHIPDNCLCYWKLLKQRKKKTLVPALLIQFSLISYNKKASPKNVKKKSL